MASLVNNPEAVRKAGSAAVAALTARAMDARDAAAAMVANQAGGSYGGGGCSYGGGGAYGGGGGGYGDGGGYGGGGGYGSISDEDEHGNGEHGNGDLSWVAATVQAQGDLVLGGGAPGQPSPKWGSVLPPLLRLRLGWFRLAAMALSPRSLKSPV